MIKDVSVDTAIPPRVACIIPYYNGSSFIERAIESTLVQTYPFEEIIVINDGSKSSELEALQNILAKYPTVKLYSKENGGQGSARNFGVNSTDCDYICFLDQDDFYLPNHNKDLLEGFPHNDPVFGWVYGDLYEAEGDGSIVRTSMVREHSEHPKRSISQLMISDMFVLPSASLINKKAFLAVGGFDERFMGYEDDDLFFRLFRAGYKNYFIDKSVTVWCIHSESTSYSIRMLRSRNIFFKKLVENMSDDPVKARYYYGDCLMPRFGHLFFSDATKATVTQSDHKEELVRFFREYVNITWANKSVPLPVKLKLRAYALGLERVNPKILNSAIVFLKQVGVRPFSNLNI